MKTKAHETAKDYSSRIRSKCLIGFVQIEKRFILKLIFFLPVSYIFKTPIASFFNMFKLKAACFSRVWPSSSRKVTSRCQ